MIENNTDINMANSEKDMSLDEEQALNAARFSDIQKKLIEASWNDEAENLMRSWGIKSAALRWLHFHSATKCICPMNLRRKTS